MIEQPEITRKNGIFPNAGYSATNALDKEPTGDIESYTAVDKLIVNISQNPPGDTHLPQNMILRTFKTQRMKSFSAKVGIFGFLSALVLVITLLFFDYSNDE